MREHWWWRPGWAPGRQHLEWYLTFAGDHGVRTAAESYRVALRPLRLFDEVPDESLHMSLQGLGFADELDDEHLKIARQRTVQAVSVLPAFDLPLDPVHVGEEGVWLPADPIAPLLGLRSQLRAAAGDLITGTDDDTEGFWPHMAVAYCHSAGPAAPVQAVIDDVPPRTVVAHVAHVDLVAVVRDGHQYTWTTLDRVALTG